MAEVAPLHLRAAELIEDDVVSHTVLRIQNPAKCSACASRSSRVSSLSGCTGDMVEEKAESGKSEMVKSKSAADL
jgi:hypothetical protein